jgi:hypothetical protein
MYNTKAFLEGLIVNEVLTKTASFEKLAQQPVTPYSNWLNLTQSAQQQYGLESEQRRNQMQRNYKLRQYMEDSGFKGELSKLPPAARAAAAHQISAGALPDANLIEELKKRYSKQAPKVTPASKVPAEGAPGPATKATPPGMGSPGLKPPTSPSYPSYPPYPSQPPPSMSGDIKA